MSAPVIDPALRARLEEVAIRSGLVAIMAPHGSVWGVHVERDAEDWSMAPTQIALARTEDEAARKAIDAIKALAPQIAKKVAQAQPDEPDGITIAGGIGADGTVTALRVERDGTVRLHPDDIELIAEAVARRLANSSQAALKHADEAHYASELDCGDPACLLNP